MGDELSVISHLATLGYLVLNRKSNFRCDFSRTPSVLISPQFPIDNNHVDETICLLENLALL